MSTISRKIGYYNLIFKKHGEGSIYFNKQHFLDFLLYLDANCEMIDITKKNKAFTLNFYRHQLLSYNHIVDLTFKSCKYNHSPELMSKINGQERDSDKALDEGEKELTHVSLKITDAEAEIIFEERRSGISISEFGIYINRHYRKYNASKQLPNNHSIEIGMITTEDFLSALNSLTEIKLGEVYTDTEILGSDMLNLISRQDRNLSNEVILKIKASPKESIAKRTIKGIFDKIGTTESNVSRLRIYGKDSNNNGIRIDSSILKQADYVDVDLEENGVVNSQSIFDKMHQTLGVRELEEMEV